jgi:H-type small acid-soluble spore protein
MDVNRAKEIISSSEQFEVQYGGRAVWIDSVDAQTKMATVHPQDIGTQESMTVQVNDLVEVGKIATRM